MMGKVKQVGNESGYVRFKQDVVALEEEMASLDCFGPMAREAMAFSPIQVLAHTTLRTIIDQYEKMKMLRPDLPELDLKRPDVDAGIARGILTNTYHLMLTDREPQDARDQETRALDAKLSLQPIIPKRLRRAIR